MKRNGRLGKYIREYCKGFKTFMSQDSNENTIKEAFIAGDILREMLTPEFGSLRLMKTQNH